MEVCALRCSLQAWLRNAESEAVHSANGNALTMRQVSQDRYESKQKQLLLLKSRRNRPPQGTPSMHGSWREHRGAPVLGAAV